MLACSIYSKVESNLNNSEILIQLRVSCAGLVAYIEGEKYFKDTERQAEENKKNGFNGQI